MSWHDFDKFSWADERYLPACGEGETMATQAVTAIAKLVYKWFNDGDVFDNTYHMEGWANDLSSYANWLHANIPDAAPILREIKGCETEDEYEQLLYDLTSLVETEARLEALDKCRKTGSVYKCDGPYKYADGYSDDEDEDDDEDDEYEDEDD